ncbi:hypothetical protein IMSAG249_00580 [Lachnospiraceae bacterium]|nr:hypothetical protein IMSAG249_00580 [Lachnospiraceae bacterium]
MRKKALAVTLIASLLAASLTGCGTEVKATDQEVIMDEETIVVSEGDSSISLEEGDSTDTESTNDIVAEDVVAAGGDIVFYDKVGDSEYGISAFSFESIEEKVVNAVDDISVYSEEGIKVGFVKGGATVILTEHGINSRWYRFENPMDGTSYNYLCMLDDDIPIDESELLTSDEVREWIIESISNRDFAIPTFLDGPDSDMQYVEFSIDRQENYGGAGWKIDQVLFSHGFDVGDFTSSDYSTFYVECTKNDMNIDCKIYYKDFVE